MKTSDGLQRLNHVMGQLGFSPESDPSAAEQGPKQLRSVLYADGDGNRVELRFSLHISPGRSGLMIEASFNDAPPRVWYSLESVIEGIEQAVQEWKQPKPAPAAKELPAPKPAYAGARPKLTTAAVINDVRAGMDDAGLQAKYGLSHRRLLSVMSKLVWEGLLTQEELARRKALARTVFMPVYQCRLCKEIQFEKHDHCPRCGGPMTKANKRGSDSDD